MSKVRFAAEFPGAKQVHLAGDFNNWDPTELRMRHKQKGQDVFVATVDLQPGRHQYKYVVDGEWMCAPDAPCECACEGVENNVVEV
jgi:5'-AMP-activated protein kinase regulatory beta subunit